MHGNHKDSAVPTLRLYWWGAFITPETEMSREGRGYWNLETEKAMQDMSPTEAVTFRRGT